MFDLGPGMLQDGADLDFATQVLEPFILFEAVPFLIQADHPVLGKVAELIWLIEEELLLVQAFLMEESEFLLDQADNLVDVVLEIEDDPHPGQVGNIADVLIRFAGRPLPLQLLIELVQVFDLMGNLLESYAFVLEQGDQKLPDVKGEVFIEQAGVREFLHDS